ncbi:MAG: tetraacyldisaccharide 4'-kinase [Planktomarina sp.]
MKTPAFWYKNWSIWALLLSPLGALYAAGTTRRLRKAKDAYNAKLPVLCIGNINAGGTGKTPTVSALAMRLTERGKKPVILSRGHGGNQIGPLHVDPAKHTADDVGDEPILLSGFAPVVVSKSRAEGARFIESMGADVILMDDGFQSPDLKIDASIIVVDAQRGFGNGKCIPAGPLREPARTGLPRGDLLLTIGPKSAQDKFDCNVPIPRIQGVLKPLETGMPWGGMPAYAFAGIGHPEKFFNTLKAAGVDLRGTQALADHQPISRALFDRMKKSATAAGAQLLTTEKDAARLPADLRPLVLPFPVRLHLGDWSAIDDMLDRLEKL